MSDRPRTDLQPREEGAERERLIEDLERRISALEALDESDYGRFTSLDWIICVVGSIVLPAIALWWFAG